jgi:hypothetical protein
MNDFRQMGNNWFVLNLRHPLEFVRRACVQAAETVGMQVGPESPRYLLLCPEQTDEPEAVELYRTAIVAYADQVAPKWPAFASQLRLWRNTWTLNPGGRVLVPVGTEIVSQAPAGEAGGPVPAAVGAVVAGETAEERLQRIAAGQVTGTTVVAADELDPREGGTDVRVGGGRKAAPRMVRRRG